MGEASFAVKWFLWSLPVSLLVHIAYVKFWLWWLVRSVRSSTETDTYFVIVHEVLSRGV